MILKSLNRFNSTIKSTAALTEWRKREKRKEGVNSLERHIASEKDEEQGKVRKEEEVHFRFLFA